MDGLQEDARENTVRSTYQEQAARAAARLVSPKKQSIVCQNGMPTNKHERKCCPIHRGAKLYFPDALACVSNVSFVGNEQHNPGEPMYWARGKSNDHLDCAERHLAEAGTIDDDGLRHTAKAAWRLLAALQLEIEADKEKTK